MINPISFHPYLLLHVSPPITLPLSFLLFQAGPVRTDEVAFLHRLFYKLSRSIAPAWLNTRVAIFNRIVLSPIPLPSPLSNTLCNWIAGDLVIGIAKAKRGVAKPGRWLSERDIEREKDREIERIRSATLSLRTTNDSALSPQRTRVSTSSDMGDRTEDDITSHDALDTASELSSYADYLIDTSNVPLPNLRPLASTVFLKRLFGLLLLLYILYCCFF